MLTYEQIQSLNDLEMNVYNYILENKHGVLGMTIRELAKQTHVSTTVITHFCKKADCYGYTEFKLKLKTYLTAVRNGMQKLGSSPALDAIIQLETGKDKKEKIRNAVELIKEADNIIFIGIGQSGVMAKYGSIYFSNCGISSTYMSDSYFRITAGNSNDLVIALSASGFNTEIIYRIEKFKELKVPIISITNTESCTIAKLANVSITYNVPEEIYNEAKPSGDMTISRTTQVPVMYIIETLAKEL